MNILLYAIIRKVVTEPHRWTVYESEKGNIELSIGKNENRRLYKLSYFRGKWICKGFTLKESQKLRDLVDYIRAYHIRNL